MNDNESPLDAIAPDELIGDRVVLRAWRVADATDLFAAVDESRDHLRPWLSWVDNHPSIDDSVNYCLQVADSWVRRVDFALGIWDRSTGRLLGGAGYHNINWAIPSFDIGYWIRAGEGGKGYVSEVVRLQTTFAFEQLGAQRLVITCDANNVRSRAVPDRLGFASEARLRNQERNTSGHLRDTLIFAMIPEDYQSFRKRWHGFNQHQPISSDDAW